MKEKSQRNRTYSVIIVSDATSSSRTFSVSAKLVRRSITAFFAFFLFFGFILFHYLSINLDKQRMRQLIQEKKENEKKMIEMKGALSGMEKSLKEMAILSEKIMVITGITSLNNIQQVGEGGPMTEEAAMVMDGMNSQGIPSMPNRTIPRASPNLLAEKAKTLEKTFNQALTFVNNQNLRYAATPSIAPTRGYIASAFSRRTNPFTQTQEFHSGLDISTQLGQKIIAPADGTVLAAESRGGFGKMIIIDHEFGFTSQYAHLSAFNVRPGQRIKRRGVIGFVGNTGMSTAPHLHYEVHFNGKPVNPFYFILDWGKE